MNLQFITAIYLLQYVGVTFQQRANLLLNIFDILSNLQMDPNASPSIINDNNVSFYLYTRSNRDDGLDLREFNLSDLDSSMEVKLIIHGWTESAKRPWYKNMIQAYLNKSDYNMIAVDWSGPASKTYPVSARNTKFVGEIVGRQIAILHKEADIPLERVHILGHSLGGHVAGFAGKEVYKLTGAKVNRITGLDPAGPLFEVPPVDKQNRLSEEDATMVDVIHTDGGVFGFLSPIGTIDFYPNGGNSFQPGCNFWDLVGLLAGSLESVFCSHMRSYIYFIESISKPEKKATLCDSYDSYERGSCIEHKIPFGDFCSPDARGMYFFKTNSQPPYLF